LKENSVISQVFLEAPSGKESKEENSASSHLFVEAPEGKQRRTGIWPKFQNTMTCSDFLVNV
jgi:hypothetical protein